MSVTHKQIADKVGVSEASVSVALGSSGRIAAKTKARILQAAEELGYRPNKLVQGIQTGKSMTVGVLLHCSGDPYEDNLFRGIYKVLAQNDYVPIVLSGCDELEELSQVHALIDRRVDGLLLRPFKAILWEDFLPEILGRDIPVVSVDIEMQARFPEIDFVGTDETLGTAQAADALLNAGHRRLGVVTTKHASAEGVKYKDSLYYRHHAFQSYVSGKQGVSCSYVEAFWAQGIHGYESALNLLSQEDRPTGVFVTMDHLAVGVYHAARELGLRIPEDLSVVGYANNPISQALAPQLSTIHQHADEVGSKAAGLLLERIQGRPEGDDRRQILIEPEWVSRDSVAPPPQPKR
ncbi:LacI family DNA-binding transcriptional regulator [Algisphaera agarilytica]|uniref:LacI family transcriptional regulator n=1 Tax=Algisphaera agarilytica TaxID=1385975 RepID=A0A7X0H953_9BACT|nr:LacI family DNA-binding transcriptional regulator [Algisphaera agarilytica]MBB6431584.1 LacI family transcriptional regulator [Algisphaera agarilytica]